MLNIQLTDSLRKLIAKTINKNEIALLNNSESIFAEDSTISFRIYLDIKKDALLLPIPVDQLDDLKPSLKEKLPTYIGISHVKFK